MLASVSIFVGLACASAGSQPSNTGAKSAFPPFTCPDTSGIFPNIYDCGSYYLCDFGKATLEYCPAGLQFDPTTHICQYPEDISPPCVPVPLPTTPPPAPPAGRLTVEPFTCPTEFGLYKDPYDCASYFQCSYWVAYVEHCQPGLQYNPAKQYCDYPANIQPPCVPIPYPTTTRSPPLL